MRAKIYARNVIVNRQNVYRRDLSGRGPGKSLWGKERTPRFTIRTETGRKLRLVVPLRGDRAGKARSYNPAGTAGISLKIKIRSRGCTFTYRYSRHTPSLLTNTEEAYILPDMNQADRIIAKFGGINAMSRILGHNNPSTVQGWRERGRIPSMQHQAIWEAAKAHRIDLDLAEFAAVSPIFSKSGLLPNRS